MAEDDAFEPHLGRLRNQGGKRARSYLQRVLAATNLARGGARAVAISRRTGGSRAGRGAGIGSLLATRDRHAAFRQRRVIIKTRIVKLAGKGAAAAVAHLRYLQRDGTTRDGQPGHLYGPDSDRVDGPDFQARGAGDRHQFRFIVSPEDGAEYDDLRPLTRRLMTRMEQDLGTTLDWVAVDHFNTGHPHTHILVRGKDHLGKDLIVASDYLTHGLRERAAELVDLDLGPRTDREIEARLRSEVEQERLTSIDRALLRDTDGNRELAIGGRDAFDQSVRAGRLVKLARLGLAEPIGPARYRLAAGLEDTLRQMGERGDIIRTMQRAFTRSALERPLAEQAIYDPAEPDTRALIGRVIARGLADELADRHYLVVDGIDGRSHYVAIGRGDSLEPVADGAIVRIEPMRATVRQADRTIAAVAATNDGRYDVEAHLRHDPTASRAFAEAHVRRLEAFRRATGAVVREASGRWSIAADHLDRVADYEAARLKDRPVTVQILSPQPLARLERADAATWLDRELVSPTPEPLRDGGFGHEVRDAQARRRQWLVAQGFAERDGDDIVYPAGMLRALQGREVLRVAAQLSPELHLPFVESPSGTRIDGIYRRSIDTAGGRFAVIEQARDFTLVPWRPALERNIGKNVSGIMRGDGISWTIGRDRGGPTIS